MSHWAEQSAALAKITLNIQSLQVFLGWAAILLKTPWCPYVLQSLPETSAPGVASPGGGSEKGWHQLKESRAPPPQPPGSQGALLTWPGSISWGARRRQGPAPTQPVSQLPPAWHFLPYLINTLSGIIQVAVFKPFGIIVLFYNLVLLQFFCSEHVLL